jgi:hypothetical protein
MRPPRFNLDPAITPLTHPSVSVIHKDDGGINSVFIPENDSREIKALPHFIVANYMNP